MKSPLKKAKETLWQLCRTLTFKRYGTNCYTCPARNLSGRNLQCGHFIPKSVCSTEMAYALANLRPQCFACNINRSGNWPAFERHLLADGIDIAALKQQNEDTKGLMYRSDWFEEKIAEYQKLL